MSPPKSLPPQTTLDVVVDLLQYAQLDTVTANTPYPDIEERLRVLVSQLNGADPLRRTTLRQMVIDKLKDAKVDAAARLVDAAFAVLSKGEHNDGLQGQAVRFADPEPWSESVDGAELLPDLEQFITRFMVVPASAA